MTTDLELRNHPYYQQGLRDGMKILLVVLAFWGLLFYLFL